MDIAQYLAQGPKTGTQTSLYEVPQRKAAPEQSYHPREDARAEDADVREAKPYTPRTSSSQEREDDSAEVKSLFRELMQKKLARKKQEQAQAESAPLSLWKFQPQKPLQSDNPLLAKETKLDPATLLAQSADAQENAGKLKLDPVQELFATLELNRKAFIDLLTQAQANQDAKGAGTLENAGSIKIDQKSLAELKDQLQVLLQAQGGTLDAAALQESPLTSNLTPAQLSALKEALAQMQKSVQLTQAAPKNPDGALEQKTLEEAARQALQTQRDLLRRADTKAQITPAREQDSLKALQTRLAADTLIGAQTATTRNTPASSQNLSDDAQDFASLLTGDAAAKTAVKAGVKDIALAPAADTPKTPAKIAPGAGMILPALPAAQNWSESWALPADSWINPAAAAGAAAPVTGLGALTALTTQGQAATAPHPVAPVVAAALNKAASQGQNKTLELQLDPPELGRLQIRMQYGRDKMVKAVIMSEKPETHMMLQRDAHVLERALQQAGVDMDQSSLSFALGHQQEFSHNGGHDSRSQQFGTKNASSKDDAGEIQTINASVDWQVDPRTGHVHYSLLV